jgi:hypothetical protein
MRRVKQDGRTFSELCDSWEGFDFYDSSTPNYIVKIRTAIFFFLGHLYFYFELEGFDRRASQFLTVGVRRLAKPEREIAKRRAIIPALSMWIRLSQIFIEF